MTDTTNTEAIAHREICAWSQQRPVWQRDALKRLTRMVELSEQDIDELTALCLDPSKPSAPLEMADLSSPETGLSPVQLKSVGNVQNVNALAENQRLGFLAKGVTIIYGDNGAGKSGYVRILKQACRARGSHAEILSNINESASGPQSAEITFIASGQERPARWQDGAADSGLLTAVSVFDSITANVHVDATNDLAYTPFPIQLLERLVHACRDVKDCLEEKISEIKAKTPNAISSPECSSDTEVGSLIYGISKDTPQKELSRLATLSKEEEKRYAQLAYDFNQDPKRLIARLESQIRRLTDITEHARELENAASRKTLNELKKLDQDLRKKQKAVRLAARGYIKDDDLPGTGEEAWRELWEAARDFSMQEAYPDMEFPAVGNKSRCVLCQQTLDRNAAKRLERFESFVKDRTQQLADAARSAVDDFISDMEANIPDDSQLREDMSFLRDDLDVLEGPKLSKAFSRFSNSAIQIISSVLSNRTRPAIREFSAPIEPLKKAAATINERIEVLRAKEGSAEWQAQRQEYQELSDRKWLSGVKKDAVAEIRRKKQLSKLMLAKSDTQHTGITRKSTELAELLVTDQLRERFAQEVKKLGIERLAIELKKDVGRLGVPRFRVSLTQKPDAKASLILSEGEHRCVALAGFLAELATADNRSGIIFDDPVSSLDHLHREAIAKRLAREGRQRQVIVFTHDLPFMFLLERSCSEPDEGLPKTQVAIRYIARHGDEPGHCDNKAPMKAQTAAKRVTSIGNHLKKSKIQYKKDPGGSWTITAKGIIVEIRDTWEGAVEAAVSPVLKTFAYKVDTKGLAMVSAITFKDAEIMRAAYGRCSELLHKASEEMNPSVPTPDQIEGELKTLSDWLEDVSQRQKEISKKHSGKQVSST